MLFFHYSISKLKYCSCTQRRARLQSNYDAFISVIYIKCYFFESLVKQKSSMISGD